MVPHRRAGLVAVQLIKNFLSGPQDISLADEAGNDARRLWESLGGTVLTLHSLYWGRFLRPSQFLLSRMTKNKAMAPLVFASTPFYRFVDAVAARAPGSPFRLSASRLSAEEMEAETLLASLTKHTRRHTIRPEYDARSLRWLLEILNRREDHGRFQKVLLRRSDGEVAGWYLYYPNPGGIGEVLQIGATADSIHDVLDHLFHHAWRLGTVALSGRLEPRFLHPLWERRCLFHHRGVWMLVHAHSPELLAAIACGNAFLTRLEGEWCMRFHAGTHPLEHHLEAAVRHHESIRIAR